MGVLKPFWALNDLIFDPKNSILASFWTGPVSVLLGKERASGPSYKVMFICCLFLLFCIVCLFVCLLQAQMTKKLSFLPKKQLFLASFLTGPVSVLFGKERAFGLSYKVMFLCFLFVLFCIVSLLVLLFKKGLRPHIIVWAAGPQLRANGPSIWPKARRQVIQSQKVAGAWRSQAPGSF